jgi:hypothetical protein
MHAHFSKLQFSIKIYDHNTFNEQFKTEDKSRNIFHNTSLYQLPSVDLELQKYCEQHLGLRMQVTQWQSLQVGSKVTDSACTHYLLNSVCRKVA